MTTSATNSMRFSKRRKYGVIYADPPWSLRNWSAKGTGRNAISHYDCLDFEALAALPVADLAKDNCALFLWAPIHCCLVLSSFSERGALSTKRSPSIG
jgi:N6-adenosine-specific RNA methylase IME4